MNSRVLLNKVVIVITISLLIFSVGTVLAQSNDVLLQKTDSELYKRIQKLDDDETVDIYIWRTSILQEDYESELLKLGFDETIYADEVLFQLEVINKLDNPKDEKRIIAIREAYKMARRNAIKSVSLTENQKFIEDYSFKPKKIIHFSKYTTSLIIATSKAEIESFINDSRVLGISLYNNEIAENELSITVNQINAGYGTSQNPGLKNTSQGGYDGTGVSIGIIEAESGRFNPNAPQLSDMVSSGTLEYIDVQGVNEQFSEHATHVTNIICGQSYDYQGTIYEGIATGSQVYQSAIKYTSDVYTAFEQFVDLGVDVINFSGYLSTTSTYESSDKQIDNLIYNSKVLFVKSSGNTSNNVTSPGKAYNAITVGNAYSKITSTMGFPSIFPISPTSGYNVASYLSNKPEVVAPGTLVSSVGENGIITETGTSFSAPHVAGLLAQLVEKYKASVSSQNYVTYFKARLLLGAQASLVNDTTHRVGDSSAFYNKQGAGFLDAVNSSQSIDGWNKYKRVESLSLNYYVYLLSKQVDYSIRAVLIYEKPENINITSAYGNNLNLYLQSPSGTIYQSSTSTKNNFELFEYTIPANQQVQLRINRAAYLNSSEYMSISCYWMEVD